MIKYYDLTIPQKAIWYTNQFYKNTSITNVSGTCYINHEVDINLLEKAINIVVENNDALRIRIAIKDNLPKQYFEEYEKFEVVCFCVENKKESEKIIEYLVSKHIDIANEKSVKFTIFKFPDRTAGFNVIGSHIVSDAWGSARICSEVVKVYSKLANIDNENEILKSSYIDYIENENEYINSEKYEKDKIYWEEKFENLSDKVVSIIPINENTSIETKAIRKEISLNKNLTEKINQYCSENRVSPFVFFLGVYSIYILELNGENECAIGTPMLNRKGIKEKEIVGMFVNNQAFRINIEENEKLLNLFEKIGQDSMQMLRHQKYSYMELLKKIREKTKTNNNLYDVVISYQNAKTTANKSKIKYSSEWNFNGNISETINIHISDLDSEKKYKIYYDYQVNKLNNKDILDIHKRILNIINQIIEKKIENIEDIEIITEEEIEKIKEFNNTGKVKIENKNVINILEEVCEKYPNKVALKFGDEEVTYKEMKIKIDCLAIKLRNKGVKRNSPVIIVMDKSINLIISMFAILKAGGCYVPILPEEQKDRIKYIIDDCKPVIAIINNKYNKLIQKVEYIDIDNEKYINNEKIHTINEMDDIAYIIYTSGTTGEPKGVKIMHKNIASLKISMEKSQFLKPTSEDISMSLLKYSFDASQIDIYSALLFGGKLILVNKEDELNPSIIIKLMEREKVTRSFLIPKWLENINREDEKQKANLSSLRVLGTGGEILKPELIKHLYKKYKNLKIINLYGPTEATMFTTYKIISNAEVNDNETSIGKPIYGSKIFIVNSKNQVLPLGIEGELCVFEDENSIKNIAKGYLNKKEQTEKKFVKIYNPITRGYVNSYKTGDIVRINSELELEFEGRKDDVVKVNGGYLIALNEVEKRINDILEDKYKVSVFAIPLNNTKAIVAFISRKEKEVGIENLLERIKSKLTFYMHPKKIIELDELPVNNSGKVDKKKLRMMAEKSLHEKENKISPKTTTEKIVFSIIKKYTEIENISIEDDFIQDLGIDSLTIATLYTELEEFGIEMQDIYTHTNIKDLAHFIDVGKDLKDDQIEKNIHIINNSKKFNLENILLTGVTGFLGIHLLYEFAKNKNVKKIYCIIRKKEDLSAKKRFEKNMDYYFKDKKIKKIIKQKVTILEGNITDKYFGLSKENYNMLEKDITTVINSAANVRHYGKEESLNSINVDSVKKIIEFCEKNDISLGHISTLSIAGFRTEKSEKEKFDENSIYIGQKLNNNPYLISKYNAEELIIKNKNVNSKIFRVGNIMPRISDGKFQENYTQNAFMNAIKIILDLKKIPEEYLKITLELSPVDECAKTIAILLQDTSINKVFHIVNDKLITIEEIVKVLENLKYEIDTVNITTFIKELNKYSGIGKYYIKEYVLKNELNNYESDITKILLNNSKFEWESIDKKYIKNIKKIIEKNRW